MIHNNIQIYLSKLKTNRYKNRSQNNIIYKVILTHFLEKSGDSLMLIIGSNVSRH